MSQHGFEVVGVSSSGPELNEVAKEEGIRVVPLEMTRTISPWKDIRALWQMYRLCRKEKPDIVHSHTPKAGIIGMLGARLADVPNRFHTVAGLPLMETTGLKRSVLNFVEKLTYACATKVYPNSKGLYDFIVTEEFCNPSKLKVLGEGSSNGIDTAFFSRTQIPETQLQELRQSLGLLRDDFVFIFVGRLVGDKGINELVHAFKETNLPQTKLLLVGPLETALDALLPETLKEIENNKSILSVGYQDDVRPYFTLADALVFPSYREGFPNVVLQAGAMELPAIVTDINGCNEMIIEGENGLIVPPKNTEQLRAAMTRLVVDKKLYNELKANTRDRIIQNYEQSVVWQAILKEYKNAEQDV